MVGGYWYITDKRCPKCKGRIVVNKCIWPIYLHDDMKIYRYFIHCEDLNCRPVKKEIDGKIINTYAVKRFDLIYREELKEEFEKYEKECLDLEAEAYVKDVEGLVKKI